MHKFVGAVLALILCLAVGMSSGATYYLYPDNAGWSTTLSSLQAGDTAIFAAGTYTLTGYYALNLAGTAAAPIVVKGAGAGQTIIRQQSTVQNIVNMVGQYFSFYNMSFTGGSRGVRLGPQSASYVTFEGVQIYHTQATAFSANDAGAVYSNLVLRRMEVYDTGSETGECFYLGCNNDACQVRDSLVELNYCHDTATAQAGYGSGIQLKTGSYRNIIRDNVIYNTGAPGILIYDDYQRGVNLVEGNVIVGTQDAGIQLSSGAIIRNNIVVGAAGYGIFLANNQNQQSGVFHDVQIVHNTVYNSGAADLYLRALSGSQFVIANNAFLSSSNAFAVQTQTNTVWLKNAYVSGSAPPGVPSTGVFQVTAGAVINAGANNFYPSVGSPLINAGSTAYPSPATRDYNGSPRTGSTPTVGAFTYTTSTNPGAAIARGFKTLIGSAPAASASSVPSASRTPSSTPTRTPTRTPSPSTSKVVAPSATRTPTATPTRTPTRTPSPSTSKVVAPSPSRTPTATPTRSPTRTPTRTPSPSTSKSPSTGNTYYLTPTSAWTTTIGTLQAGDTAILAAGTYTLNGYWALNLVGSASAKIKIKGAGTGQTIIRQLSTAQNILNVQGQHFGFYDLDFTGGSRGIRLGTQSTSYATFDNVRIYSTQSTAFSANDAGAVYSNLVLRRMEVFDTGYDTSECFYLGCNNDACQVRDSLVERNYCHDTTNAVAGFGSGVQIKTGSYNNIVRDNVFYNVNAPGVLLYSDYQRGANLVEGNVIINSGDNGIQVSSGALIRNNIIVGAAGYGIFLANNQNQQSGVYSNVQIVHNTIYNSGYVDLYLPALSGSQFVVANNAFLSANAFAVQTQTNTVWLKNAYVGSTPAGVPSTGVFQVTTGAVTNAAANNFYPSATSALKNAGSAAYTAPATKDFNNTPRSNTTPTVGAYEYTTTTNPGPAIGPGFKF
ncbi:uncharacterized protein ACA1_157590 [Acanthamoeba castellanii str. Neff]|uniref:Right handed beta helix domain-containing protein n=1 Tax=Acanthamoeba castellanii (strain ATCC 30010 / Neff) TaxID=1257118 RepID=L8H9W4_ACACF|nr:uncharacterized protein ACA1_157590 [Acanthamoeba castellanii str. Neff]ELR22027.1 hypothetical protein ACA1_157590 [Acanthamoeba castellanii str. Neff]